MSTSLHTGVPTQALTALDFPRVLQALASHARTTMGVSKCELVRLYSRPNQVQYQLALTSEIRHLLDTGNQLPFGGIRDVRPLLAHAAKQGVLDSEDLIAIADTLRGFWALSRYIDGRADDFPKIASIAIELPELEILRELIFDAFDDRGELRDDASIELKELRAKRRTLHLRIRKRIAELVHDPEVLDRLQDDYYTIREDRYVLPVRSGERSEVPGIIHGNSQTGRTLYIEPQELVPLNNELKICQQAVALEEHRILAELTRDISSHSEAIELGLELVGQLDMISARARLAQKMDAVCPDVTTSDLSLLGARNPLLVLRELNVVPNDISFADEVSFLVITGPNAGGKTVTLSTLGLCALMTRAGLHIPVLEGSKVPIYPQILCVVGDQQDMQQDLSTFSGHLAQLHSTINAAASGALVLLDEIAAGTEANQGAALAIAVLEHLATIGASGATTTHYDRLKTLGLEDSRFVNASVTLDPATDDPTFRLTLGTPGTSSALQMARKNGFPEALITRAEAILGDRTHSVEKILRRLDTERAALEEQRCQLEAQQQTLAKETDHHRRAIERLQERGDEIIREERDAVFRDLNEARGALRRIVRELQRDKSPRSVTRRQAQLAELEKRLETHESPVDIAQPARAISIDIAAPGLEVFVPSFEKDGRIEEVRGKKALVAIGALKTMVPIAELQLPQPKEPEAKRRESPMVEQSDVAPVRTNANTCDVRGMRVDEAIREVERFLDRLLLKNRAAGYILHGYGTGRLKQGLHEAFRRSAYVRQYESASQDRGGDAVTLVWLQ